MKLKRVRDAARPEIALSLDGQPMTGQAGDTLLTALLSAEAGFLNTNPFLNEPRAGFCYMGACQDCWVDVDGRGRVRACSTLAEPGMSVRRL